jgi:hypothetical protein
MDPPDSYENIKKSTINVLELLFEKYKNDPIIVNKIGNEIKNGLEKTLETHITNLHERTERKTQLTKIKDEFTCRFLNKNNYFYLPNVNFFVLYNKQNYVLYNEDDIVHEILTQISRDKELHQWKHKINKNIIKIIKNKTAADYIPETGTIQNVLQYLYPVLFKNKYSAKYFLTVLGDIILKKTSNLVYIISIKFSPILKDLSNYCYNYFETNQIFNTIKFKYYDHDYDNCRLLLVNDVHNTFEFPEYFYKNILNLFCVAIHYSHRYGSADDYLKDSDEIELVNHTLYLKNNTQDEIINSFINTMLQKSDTESHINTSNMLYLWTKYLKIHNLPNVVKKATFKDLLKSKLTYNPEISSFINLTSTHLPIVAQFIHFWDTTMIEDTKSLGFEADELVCLFKKYLGKSSIVIKDDMLIEWILHYYPHIVIHKNKYILKISNLKWNKITDFKNALILFLSSHSMPASLDDFYRFYCKFAKEEKYIFVMSKYYFDLIAPKYLNIDEDRMITYDPDGDDESCV